MVLIVPNMRLILHSGVVNKYKVISVKKLERQEKPAKLSTQSEIMDPLTALVWTFNLALAVAGIAIQVGLYWKLNSMKKHFLTEN